MTPNDPAKKHEATLILIKPDGIKKSLTGNILTRLSETKLVIIGAKMRCVDQALAVKHYEHLKEQKFFSELIKYIMGEFHTKRVMALVYYGRGAIQKVRDICGATNPEEADPVSIRGSYGRITTKGVYENVIHASEKAEDARREIKLWFSPDELTVQELYPSKQVEQSGRIRAWV